MDIQTGAPVARKANSTLKLAVGRSVVMDLKAEALRRGVEFEKFVVEILDAVATHDLYAAVLEN